SYSSAGERDEERRQQDLRPCPRTVSLNARNPGRKRSSSRHALRPGTKRSRRRRRNFRTSSRTPKPTPRNRTPKRRRTSNGPPPGGGLQPIPHRLHSAETLHKFAQPIMRERFDAMIVEAGDGAVVDQRIYHRLLGCLDNSGEERVHEIVRDCLHIVRDLIWA